MGREFLVTVRATDPFHVRASIRTATGSPLLHVYGIPNNTMPGVAALGAVMEARPGKRILGVQVVGVDSFSVRTAEAPR